MEEVDDDDENLGTYPRNIVPLNMSRILELSDGTDDDDCPPLIPRDDDGDEDDDSDDDDDGSEPEKPEESAEAELGQLWHTTLISS
jgi:hypothetical protein